MINKQYDKGFWRFDENDFCLEPWENNNTQDGLGRNAFLYINYPNQKWLKESLFKCIKQRDDSYIQFYRYPNKGANTISRDHVAGVILALYLNKDWKELEWILDNLPWRLSRKYSQTIDFWLWQKMLRAEIKGKTRIQNLLSYSLLFLILIEFCIIVPLNLLIEKLLHIRRLELKDFPNSEVQTFKGHKKLIYQLKYPTFALFTLGFQLMTIQKGQIIKWIIRNLQLRWLINKSNLVLRYIITRRSIKENEYKKYTGMTSFIWSRPLDTTDEVYINQMNEREKEYNDINQSMLDYCYMEIDKFIHRSNKTNIIQKLKDNENIFETY